MPFVSKAQQRFAFATKQPFAQKFAAQTDFKHLPERKKKGKPPSRGEMLVAAMRRKQP